MSRNKYRLRFTKDGRMRFIGHLDLLKIFQRAIKRAKLPISYSKGFNPHQLVSFGQPLSIGFSSGGEYVDLEFNVSLEADTIIDTLNAQMPDGVKILRASAIAEGEKASAALTEAAEYEIRLKDKVDLTNQVAELLSAKEVILPKRTKSGTADADIRCDIYALSFDPGENKLKMTLAAGSSRSLKPQMVTGYLYGLAGMVFDELSPEYCRLDLLQGAETGFLSVECGRPPIKKP